MEKFRIINKQGLKTKIDRKNMFSYQLIIRKYFALSTTSLFFVQFCFVCSFYLSTLHNLWRHFTSFLLILLTLILQTILA